MSQPPTTSVVVTPVHGDLKLAPTDDVVVTEAPLEIRLSDVPVAVVMRTPGHDEDLARGFLLTEAIVLDPDEIGGLDRIAGAGDRIQAALADGVVVDPEQFRRNMYTTSSCGVCGKASIDAVRITARSIDTGPVVSVPALAAMSEKLHAGQDMFQATGGLHGVGLFTGDGMTLAIREDVGRHNAVDKVVGAAALERWPLDGTVLVVSGRVSFEIVQKAAVVGIPFVVGISAASSLAVELAAELSMTIMGFVRPGRAIIYTGPERLR